jgi:hypothetical protein
MIDGPGIGEFREEFMENKRSNHSRFLFYGRMDEKGNRRKAPRSKERNTCHFFGRKLGAYF